MAVGKPQQINCELTKRMKWTFTQHMLQNEYNECVAQCQSNRIKHAIWIINNTVPVATTKHIGKITEIVC